MERRNPRISIVTPSYNQGRYLERTIQSVLDQRYDNLEYIIVDGGSTDETLEVIKKYEKHLTSWISEPDHGQSDAINKGLRRVSGELLTWLNSDDSLEPGALKIVAEQAERFPEAGAFVGHGQIVDSTGQQVYLRRSGPIAFETLCHWLEGGDFMQPSCFFRRSAWDSAGPLDESVHVAMDVDLWLRMAKAGVTFHPIDAMLSTSLAHDRAKTTAYHYHMIVDTALVVARAGGERFVRKHLNEMATKLAFYEPNFQKFMNHPLAQLALPVVRWALKPATTSKDVTPRW